MAGEVAVRNEIMVPFTAQLVDLNSPAECADALAALKIVRSQIDEIEASLERTVLDDSEAQGKKTLHYEGVTAEITGGPSTKYDADKIEAGLRRAGMPEERISEVVRETIDRKVMAGAAKQASAANPKYARVIARNSTKIDKPFSVSVK